MTDRDLATTTLRNRLAKLLSEWNAELDDGIARGDLPDKSAMTHERELRAGAPNSLVIKAKDAEIARLEAQLKHYVEAIIELKHSEAAWKEKYEELVAASVDPDATCTELQALEEPEDSLDLAKGYRG